MSKSKNEAGGRWRRDGDKERVWRERIAEQERGGESVRAFCRKRGLQEASFYHWRREIRLRDREAAGRNATPVLAPVVVVEEPSGEAVTRSQAATSIEVVLGDGTTVRVPHGATREQVGAVFAALESARC
jgi:hypothetical protein